jgi:hypothetical protein
MATAKKTVSPSPEATKMPKPAHAKKLSRTKTPADTSLQEKSSEELVIENFSALTQTVNMLTETLEMLVEKIEGMAYHVIATEEVLAEVVAANGLNLARVNARIRAKIISGTDGACDFSRAIDVAASIASPLPRR